MSGMMRETTSRAARKEQWQRRMLWESDLIDNRKASVSTTCPATTLIVADWSDVVLAMWGAGPQVEANPYDPSGFQVGTFPISTHACGRRGVPSSGRDLRRDERFVSAKLKATYPILHRGERVDAGMTFTVTSAEAVDLLAMQRVVPADTTTSERLRVRVMPHGQWRAVGETHPPLPTFAD
jgi:hypothetical protein